VGAIWGVTNVFIKRCTTEITKVTGKTKTEQFLNELKYLITNWQHVSLFLINQIGSIVFYFLLISSQISFVIPVANSVTFLFTGLTSVYIGESVPSIRKLLLLLNG